MDILDKVFNSASDPSPNYLFRGRVEKIYFFDEDTDFYIFSAGDLDAPSKRNRKLKGNVFSPRLYPGAVFEVLEGEWERSPKYGPTFVIQRAGPIYDTKPSRVKALVGACPSLRSVSASKIVDEIERLGLPFLEAMDDASNILLGFDFLTVPKAEAIHSEWRYHRSYSNVASALQGLGLPTSKIKEVYEQLGINALDIVKDNPYALALAESVSFPMADKIALNSGLSQDSKERVSSILEYLLETASNSRGHLYLERKDLLRMLERLPRLEKVPSFGRKLTQEDLTQALKDREERGRIVIDGDHVYLMRNYNIESQSAEMLRDFVGDSSHSLGVNVEEFISEYERIYGITFSKQQSEAVKALNDNKVLLLTGLPGTGKSTVTKALVRLFQKAGMSFTLLAPTGIAAKRLATVVGSEAYTVHRKLGYQGGDKWKLNENKKLVTDAVIVDEMSMVDQELLYRLLSALEPDTILVFVGDHAQLPSVGAGNVLHEMIQSKAVPRVHLTEVFRQAGASDIILNAHRINSGQELAVADPTDPNTDFKFIQKDSPEEIVEGVLYIVDRLFKNSKDSTFQVISPTYKGPLGVDLFNAEIKSLLNPLNRQQEVKIRRRDFREEDRLMVVKNHYNLGVLNGEIGKLYQINRKEKILRVKLFDDPRDRFVDFPYSLSPHLLTLAYALTVHRCCHPDTLVTTHKGLQRIEDIDPEGYILTPEGYKPYLNKVHNPLGEAVKIVCDQGYDLTVTPDHGLDVWDAEAGSYRRLEASEVTKGHFLRFSLRGSDRSSASLPRPTTGDEVEVVYDVPLEMTADLGEFLGLMVADGTVHPRGFSLRDRHHDVVERFKGLVSTLFEYESDVYPSSHEDSYVFEVNSTFLSRWLTSLGSFSPHHKSIPSCILKSSLEVQAAFLRGLFAKGALHIEGGDLIDHVDLVLKDEHLLKQVQIILLGLGIISRRSGPSLALYGHNVSLFRDKIGFVSDFKQRRLDTGIVREVSSEVVPLSHREVYSLWETDKSLFSHPSEKHKAVKLGYLSRNVVQRILDRAAEKGISLPWLDERMSWHHARVETLSKTECESYCVEVPDGHRFLQDGCSGWNCQGQEFDYVILPFHEMFSVQLQRNLLYTAVTRAKKKVFIFGQWKALHRAIANDSVTQRNTNFSRRLRELLCSADPFSE